MSAQIYICDNCDKKYSSYMGLWKHKKNIHKTQEENINEKNINNEKMNDEIINNDTNIIDIKKNICKYCTKGFSDRTSRWRHETKYCKLNKIANNVNINNTTNNTTNNNSNNTINNTTNNTVNINNTNHITIVNFTQPGCEDISKLSQDQIKLIINEGLNSIIRMIEFINFNKELPENHTFCTTALNNKYLSALDSTTHSVEKHRKIDYFDKVLLYSIAHMKNLTKSIVNKKTKKQFNETILSIENNIITNKDYKKIYIDQLNALSYNKKDIVQNTWDTLINNIIQKTITADI